MGRYKQLMIFIHMNIQDLQKKGTGMYKNNRGGEDLEN